MVTSARFLRSWMFVLEWWSYWAHMKCSLIIFLPLVLVSAVVGCASMSPGTPSSSSLPSAISVVDTDPANGATNVPLSECGVFSPFCGATYIVRFNKPLPLDPLVFTFDPPLSGAVVCPDGGQAPDCRTNGVDQYGNPIPAQSSVIVFVGASPYKADTQYTVTLGTAGYQTITGLPKDLTWTFSTSPN